MKNQSASSSKQLREPLRHHTGRWQVSPVSVQAEPLGYTSLYKEVYYNEFFVMIMEVGKSVISKLESQAALMFQWESQGRKSNVLAQEQSGRRNFLLLGGGSAFRAIQAFNWFGKAQLRKSNLFYFFFFPVICLSLSLFLSVYWSVIDLECWVSFSCTAKWFSYTLHVSILFWILSLFRSL